MHVRPCPVSLDFGVHKPSCLAVVTEADVPDDVGSEVDTGTAHTNSTRTLHLFEDRLSKKSLLIKRLAGLLQFLKILYHPRTLLLEMMKND